MDNDLNDVSHTLYEKDPVSEGSTNLLCIKKFIPKKRWELQQRGVALVLWVFVLSFVFKASFALGLESFVEIWEAERLYGKRSCACMLVCMLVSGKNYGILDKIVIILRREFFERERESC